MNRAKLRENAFKLLYMSDFHDNEEIDSLSEMYFDGQDEEINEEDKKFIVDRVKNISKLTQSIDEKIDTVAVKWSTKRMSKVDLTIIRLAYYEMKMDEDVPEKVAVDQAIELAKKYGTDESPKFVNGILAKLF